VRNEEELVGDQAVGLARYLRGGLRIASSIRLNLRPCCSSAQSWRYRTPDQSDATLRPWANNPPLYLVDVMNVGMTEPPRPIGRATAMIHPDRPGQQE